MLTLDNDHNFVLCNATSEKGVHLANDANLLRILGARLQESNLHALHLLITHCTAPIVILGRLCIEK